MASTRHVDWEQAKLLRFQGLTYKEIADTLGCKETTVAVRAHREKWAMAQQAVKETLSKAVISSVSLTLQERAQRWNAAMADSVDTSTAHLQNLPEPADWKEAIDKETALEKLTKRGRATYGLDQAGPSTVVNVAIMGEVLSNPTTDVQAIDVQEVKQENE